MILKDIYIDGFGIFNGKTISKLQKGINIIEGENEAGKSTLLRFIKYTLFGYPRFKEQRMTPLNGGNHGGRIRVLYSSGRDITFERNGSDQMTLYEHDQPSQDKTMWFQLLGNASDKIYENIYAFSLDELVGTQSLTDSGMEDRIFSIGSGMGNISVGSVGNSIRENIDNIYNPRGKNQLIPVIMNKIADLKKRTEEIQKNLPAYHELNEAVINLERDHADLEKEISAARREKDRFANYLKCYDSYIALTNIDSELSELPELKDYAPGGPEKLDRLEEQMAALKQKIREIEEGDDDSPGIAEIEAESDGLSFNEEILARAADVDYLDRNLQLFIQAVKDRDETQKDLEIRNMRISEDLKSINAKWTEQDVSDFDEVLIRQDRTRAFKKEFDNINSRKIEINAARRAIEAGRSRINPGNLLILFSVLVLLGSLVLFWFKLFIPAAACLLAAIVIFFSRKWILAANPLLESDIKLTETENKEQDLRERYRKFLTDNLDLDDELSPDAVLELLTRIISLKKEISDRMGLSRKLEEKTAFIEEYASRAGEFKEILTDAPVGTEALVRLVSEEYKSSKSGSERKATLEKLLNEKKKKLGRTKSDLEDSGKQIVALLDSIGEKNTEDFRSKYRTNDRVISLRDARKKEIATIETISGKGESQKVTDYLESSTKEEITNRLSEMESEISGKSENLKAINTLLGGKKNELRHIEAESELTEVMTELETEK
ncbi:MAG: AAA family ATPase, partial [Bacteroidales bacterium]|nr:AAA family ATPase [Bacteroidales bacterium]